MVDEERKTTRITFSTHLSLEDTLENSTTYFSQTTGTIQERRKVLEELIHHIARKTGLSLRPEGAFFDRPFFDALLTKRTSSTGHHFSLPQEEAIVLDLSRLEKVSLYHIDQFTQNFGISLPPSGFYGIIARLGGYSPPNIAAPYGCWIGFVPPHQFTVMYRLFNLVYNQMDQIGELASTNCFFSITRTFNRADREKTRRNQWALYSQLERHYHSLLTSPPPRSPLPTPQKNKRVTFYFPDAKDAKPDFSLTPVQILSVEPSTPVLPDESNLFTTTSAHLSSISSTSSENSSCGIPQSSSHNTVLEGLFSLLEQHASLSILSVETTPGKVVFTSPDKKMLLQEGEAFLREFSYFQSHPGDLLYHPQDKAAFLEQIKRRVLKLHPDLSFIFPWVKQIVETENIIQWKNLGISSYDGESAFIFFNFGTSSLVLLFCNSLDLYEHFYACKGLEPCRHIPQRYTRH